MLNAWIAGREPALLGTLIGIAIKLFGTWLDLGVGQQAVLNGATAAGIGLLVAITTHDGQSAAILGLAQALIALVIGFGLNVDPDTQAMVMSALALVIGMYERTQVTAPEPPQPQT